MGGYMATSQSNEWGTPQDLFNSLDAEFHFTLDVAASAANAKCQRFLTEEDNALALSWQTETCWLNSATLWPQGMAGKGAQRGSAWRDGGVPDTSEN